MNKPLRYKFLTCGLVAVMLVAMFQAGCASRGALKPFEEGPSPQLNTAAEAIRVLSRDYGGLNSVKVTGRIEVRLPGEEKARPASFISMLERPNKLRIRAYRPLVPPLFELVSDGCQCWVYIPSKGVVYRGDECFIGDGNVANAQFPASAIIASVLVVSDFETLRADSTSFWFEEGFVKLAMVETGDLQKEMWIDPTTGLVRRQLLVRNNDSGYAEILYNEHSLTEDAVVPVDIEVFILGGQAYMRLQILTVEPVSDISDDAFVFSVPSDVTVIYHDR